MSRISQELISEIHKKTCFEKKEVRKWHYGFVSEIPQGYLTKNDFNKIYQQFFPFGDSSPFSQLIFCLLDTDRDGRLDFEEFMCALSIVTKGSMEERLSWSFGLFDLDKDGRISRDEMFIVVESIYKMVSGTVVFPEDEDTAEKRVGKIFSTFDLDKDGFLSYEEYHQGSMRSEFTIQSLSLYSRT